MKRKTWRFVTIGSGRNRFKRLSPTVYRGHRYASVKTRQFSPVMDCKPKQVEIRDLLVREGELRRHHVAEWWQFPPIMVAGMKTELTQKFKNRTR